MSQESNYRSGYTNGLRSMWQRLSPVADLMRKYRIAMLMLEMTHDRATYAEEQLVFCRRLLGDALVDVQKQTARADRLSRQLFQADSAHLCAGETKRCYERTPVLVDAGNGEYN